MSGPDGRKNCPALCLVRDGHHARGRRAANRLADSALKGAGRSDSTRRAGIIGRSLLAAIFLIAGTVHLAMPELYRGIMPTYLPAHDALILWSGIAQLGGGLGLVVPPLRRPAAVGLMVLLIAIFPANVEMLRAHRAEGGGGWQEALLWARLPLQAGLMWAVWRLGWRTHDTDSAPAPVP